MRVHEAVNLSSSAFRFPLELEGFLIVSSHFICIVEDEGTARSNSPHFGILVNREALAALHSVDVPLLAGSSVSMVGNISLKGTVTHTGIASMPLFVPYVYEFTFAAEGIGTRLFKIGDTFKNVYLQSSPVLSAKEVAAVKSLFDPGMTIVQLKRSLEDRPYHLVAEHVRGEELNDVVAQVESAGFNVRIEECEISRGVP